jgi:methyl-accepting chemotaxis protein
VDVPLAIAPELTQRLTNYALDEHARVLLRQLSPLVEPLIGPAIDQVIAGAVKLPEVADLWQRHGAEMRRIEIEQFRALLAAEFDAAYLTRCHATTEEETALGFESRARINCGALLMRAASDMIARQFWRSGIERTAVLSRAIMFDLTTTSSYYLQIIEGAKKNRRKKINEAIAAFSNSIGGVLDSIKATSGSLTKASGAMENAALEAARRLQLASEAMAQTRDNVQSAAIASDHMANSIEEIGHQTANGLAKATSAAAQAGNTNKAMLDLNTATEHIGSIVDLISRIAAQTNLLALNATIEAARAGEAGRGFAVVATEVKTLASQTSRATEQISTQIAAIQQATKVTVREITSIAESITGLAEGARNIDGAVEEQASTTRQIAEGMQSATSATSRASDEMVAVQNASMNSASSINELIGWTERLSAAAREIEKNLDDFASQIRAA